ncbi:MAG: hypothetical protein Cons2KO_12790 [Congregibacter sp.]
MSESYAAALAQTPAQRLLGLQQAGLATHVAQQRQRWLRAWDRFLARCENRLIERVLLGRIRGVFDHLEDEARLRDTLLRLRADYSAGRAATLSVGSAPLTELIPAEEAPSSAAWLSRRPKHQRLLIYTAGGGFMLPPSTAQLSCAQRLGELCGTDALMNTHSMAPEAPFPAAIDDTVALLRWAVKNYGAKNVVLAADTAGASVTLGALLSLREEGQELPAALQLFSPWNDLSLSGWSYITKSATADSPFRMETAAFCARAYLGDVPSSEPLASAVYADLSGLPPFAIHTSRYDMHFDDALRMVESAKSSGVHGEIRYWDSPRHHLERFDTREANRSLTMASGFLRRHLDVRSVDR